MKVFLQVISGVVITFLAIFGLVKLGSVLFPVDPNAEVRQHRCAMTAEDIKCPKYEIEINNGTNCIQKITCL